MRGKKKKTFRKCWKTEFNKQTKPKIFVHKAYT